MTQCSSAQRNAPPRTAPRLGLSVVEFESLSQEERLRHNLNISALGAIEHAATPSNITKLTTACSNSNSLNGLPTAYVLKLMAS